MSEILDEHFKTCTLIGPHKLSTVKPRVVAHGSSNPSTCEAEGQGL